MKIRFTKQNIEAVEPPPKGEVFAWCADLPGWGVRILASGRKSWCVQYRDKGGRSKRHTLGDLRVLPISMAEQRAREILSHAKLGKDLLGEEQAARQRKAVERERSVGAMAAAYLSEAGVKRLRSHAALRHYLETAWKPIHAESAETIGREQLTPALRRIAGERGEISANRARSALSGMFAHAITHGWLRREANPCQYLPKWRERSRERVLSLEELGALWRAAPGVNATFGPCLRLLALTACRKSEIAGLFWHEVDLDGALIRLPGARTKNGRPHAVPLAPAAVAVLEAVPRFNDQLVFPSIGWSRCKARLDKLAPLAPWVIHDVRRSVATGLREYVGADPHLVELIINHVSGTRGGVAGVYDRSERLAERRRALEAWARMVLAAAGEPVGETKVVQLR